MSEIQELPEELNDLELSEQVEGSLELLREHRCVRFLISSFMDCSFPTVITDNTLKLVWANTRYRTLFDWSGDIEGRYLTKLFYPYLDDDKTGELYRSIRSKQEGFSWRGRVESSGRETLTVVANMMVSPIFDPEKPDFPPIGYYALLDDLTDEHRNTLRGTYAGFLEASKLKDNDTGKHVERVNEYSKILAEKLFHNGDFQSIVTREYIDNIGFLAAMHDVGKIGTPDDILNKTGKLDDWEWDIMKEHTKNGAYILASYPNPMARDIALYHHERWDGEGYPMRLPGEMIPLAARIVTIADVYDALRMERSYKEAFTHDKASKIIVQDSGNRFDPLLIRYFILLHKTFDEIHKTLAD